MNIGKIRSYMPDLLAYGFLVLLLYGISVFLTFLFGSTAPHISEYILVMGIAYWLSRIETKRKIEIDDLRDRLWNAEKALQKFDQQYAYKLEVSVFPNWEAVFTKLYGSEEWHEAFDEETKEDYHEPVNAGSSIAWQTFRFVEFFDSTNYGLGMLWSDYQKSFVYDYEVWGSILPNDGLAAQKMMDTMDIRAEETGGFGRDRGMPLFCVSPNGISSSPYITTKNGANALKLSSGVHFEQVKKAIIEAAKVDPFFVNLGEVIRKVITGKDIAYDYYDNDEIRDWKNRHILKSKYYDLHIRLTMAGRVRLQP